VSLLSNSLANRLVNRHVRVAVHPDGVRAGAWRRWPRPERLAEANVALDTDHRSADDQALALRQSLEQLALKTPIAGHTLQVELADALVHFDVAEGEFGALGAPTLASFAQACVGELLGEQAGAQVIRWQLQRDERHLLVCALPARWLDAVSTAAAAHRLRVGSVLPSFNVQWNHHLGGAPLANAVFAVADGVSVLIACVREGVIAALSSGPWFADSGDFGDSTPDRLLAGLGFAGKGAVALIDLHVDRFLAGLGVDPAAPSDYVLVSPVPAHVYLSPRWAVRRPWGDAS
jgi:hypothetical protein